MLSVRAMTPADVAPCAAILNHTIALGGSTAYEEAFADADFAAHLLEEPVVANVALAKGRVVGFQTCFDIGEGLYSIGSFTDRRNPVKGAGRALFATTLADCRALGGAAILAKITADNAGGLAYYSAMGFADWRVIPGDHIRKDGSPVDRIVKRFPL